MEAMRELYGAYRVMEIFFYYDRLRETLELAAPEGWESRAWLWSLAGSATLRSSSTAGSSRSAIL
jgi:hypothetical protein